METLAMARSRSSIPDIPLFTTITNVLPHDENSSLKDTSSLATDVGFTKKGLKQHKTSIKQNSGTFRSHSEANLYRTSPETKCRHRYSKRWFTSEIDRLKNENQQLLKASFPENNTRFHLENKIEELQLENSQLKSEREQLMQRIKEDEETTSKQKLRNKELTQDLFMLKNLVIRLNVELEKTQDRLHKHKIGSVEDIVGTVSEDSGVGGHTTSSRHGEHECKGFTKRTWSRTEMNALSPLLEAYQESLDEKEELIKNYKREMEHFTNRCKEIVAENENLQCQLMEANKKGEVTYSEWKMLQREAAMTREQNELLLRQTKLNQNKINDLHNAYQSKLTELTLDHEQLNEKAQQYKTEMYVLKGRLSVLVEECDRLKQEADNKIPVTVHTASVNECKRLFEELKRRYEDEREILSRKLAILESSRPDLDIQMVNIKADRDQLFTENKTMDKLIKRLEVKLDACDVKLRKSERSRASMKQQLGMSMAFARELITDQETLLKQLAERTQETTNVTKIGNNIASRMDTLRTKLKGVERGARMQLDCLEQRMKAQETGMDRAKAGWTKEIARLKHLVKEKETVIEQLKQEKSNTKDELELVWQVATADDKRLKESERIARLLPDEDA